MASEDVSLYKIPSDTPVNKLDCSQAFTDQEKRYAHHFSRAGWEGALICLLQTSPESPGIFLLLQQLFTAQSFTSLRELATKCGLSDQQYNVSTKYNKIYYTYMYCTCIVHGSCITKIFLYFLRHF